MADDVENNTNAEPTLKQSPGEPPGSPETPSTGPLREQAASPPEMDELDSVLELRLLMALDGLERAFQVVEDRQELLDDPLAGPRDQTLLIARGPLAVVVEVGLEALERVDQFLVLVPKRLEFRLFGGHGLLGLLVVLDVFRHVSSAHVPGPGPGAWPLGPCPGTRSWD